APLGLQPQRVDDRHESPPQAGRHHGVEDSEGVGRRPQVVLALPHQGPQGVGRHHLPRRGSAPPPTSTSPPPDGPTSTTSAGAGIRRGGSLTTAEAATAGRGGRPPPTTPRSPGPARRRR